MANHLSLLTVTRITVTRVTFTVLSAIFLMKPFYHSIQLMSITYLSGCICT